MPVPYSRSSSSPAFSLPVFKKSGPTSNPPMPSVRLVRSPSIISAMGVSTSRSNVAGSALPSSSSPANNSCIGDIADSCTSPGRPPISPRKGSSNLSMSTSVRPISPRLIASILPTMSSRISAAIAPGSRSKSAAVRGLIASTNSLRRMPAAAGSRVKPGTPLSATPTCIMPRAFRSESLISAASSNSKPSGPIFRIPRSCNSFCSGVCPYSPVPSWNCPGPTSTYPRSVISLFVALLTSSIWNCPGDISTTPTSRANLPATSKGPIAPGIVSSIVPSTNWSGLTSIVPS